MNPTLTQEEASILAHTARHGRYVGRDPTLLALAHRGLLIDAGPQPLAAGDHYLTLSLAGRDALIEWRSTQPPPPKPKPKRRTKAFEAWLSYREIYGRTPFNTYLKHIHPKTL